MTYRLLHISIGSVFGVFNHSAIQSRLDDLGKDWLNYNANCWLLWTNKSPITISEMIAVHLNPADQILVLGVNSQDLPTGFMPQWVWDWINRPRDPASGAVLTPALPAPSAFNLFDSNPPGAKGAGLLNALSPPAQK